jgi:hypothetical protein
MIPGRYYKRNKRERSVSKTGDSHFSEKTEHHEQFLFSEMHSKQGGENALVDMPSNNTKQIGAHLCEYKLIRILVKSASIMYFEYPKIYVCMLIEVELLVVDMLLLLVPTTSNNIFLLYVLMVLNLQDTFVFKLHELCVVVQLK